MLPSVSLTPAEVSALLHLPEKQVRKEIEYQILDASSPPRIPFDALVYLQALTEIEALNPSIEWRRDFYARIRTALSSRSTPLADIALVEAEASSFRFQLRTVVKAVSKRLEAFERWKTKRVATNPAVLGGEAVFRDTRLSVRQIGDLAARESVAIIIEDYPYLSPDDVTFAVQYARAPTLALDARVIRLRLLLDENLSPFVALTLREAGLDVVHVRDRGMLGATDAAVLDRAFNEDRVVVTANVDDFDKLARAREVHAGIVLVEESGLPRSEQLTLVRRAFDLMGAELGSGRDMVNRVLRISEAGHEFQALPTG